MTFTPTDLSDEEAAKVAEKAGLIYYCTSPIAYYWDGRKTHMRMEGGVWSVSKAFLWDVGTQLDRETRRFLAEYSKDEIATALLRAFIAEE